MSRFFSWLKHELLELLPIVVFFSLLFGFRSLTDTLMYERQGVSFIGVVKVILFSLIAGKVMLLTDLLPFMRGFAQRPLLYETVWKTLLYSLAALIYRALDRLISAWAHSGDFAFGVHAMLQRVGSARFWGVQLFLTVALAIFVATQSLVRAMGPHEVRRIFLGRRQPISS